MIPRIETERLVLRAMVRSDFGAYAALWQEPEVVRFIGGTPRMRDESWTAFLKNSGSWIMEGFGHWAIALRDGGQMVGQVGFFSGWRGLGADFDAAPECGWVLSAAVQGQGYGREAVEAAHRWFDGAPQGGRSHVMIEAGHEVSLQLARSIGYKAMREAKTKNGDQVILLARDLRV